MSKKDISKEMEELKKKLTESEKEKEEYLNGWKRAMADFTNARKEEETSREEFIKYAEQKLLYELIEMMDVFDRALLMQKDTGIQQLRKKMLDILKKHGVHIIHIKPGDAFDPSMHEAIQGEGDSIMHIAQNGYMMHKKLLRPAHVVVSYKK